MSRSQGLALGLVIAAVLVGAGLGAMGDEGATVDPPPSAAGEETSADNTFPVYVSGWVATPGVVDVTEGAIVADAVSMAGGALEGALLDTVNLARPLAEGDHVQIPGPGDAAAAASGPATDTDGLIRINQADAAALEDLPGVGPVLAERIVAHREANGPFETVEDLLEVPGIGEAKLASMRDLIRVP
jgi:competence protein ComEA